MPHILERISAHRRALASVLPVGAALHHKANPKATLQLERLYGGPVLLSGMPALVLSTRELGVVHRHQRLTLCRLQKLPHTTPDCVLFFLAGSLPISAVIHLRQLGLLGMLARLGEDSILHKLGKQILLSNGKGKSWFHNVRSVSTQYGLTYPLLVLQSPPTKQLWKSLCRAKVTSWWENKLRGEASLLSSLSYFHPSPMSLNTPHSLWSTASTPFEVSKATTVANMLSGRYVTDHRARYWSKINPEGHCQLCQIAGYPSTTGSLEHLLLYCPALAVTRSNAVSHWSAYMVDKPFLFNIISHHTLTPGNEGEHLQMRLLLDPSTCPLVIRAAQTYDIDVLYHLHYMTRTWCHSHHLRRRRLLKLHNII